MRWIDLTTWDRAMHYQVFKDSAQPQYSVTFDLDITGFPEWVRERGYSFTFSLVYTVTRMREPDRGVPLPLCGRKTGGI